MVGDAAETQKIAGFDRVPDMSARQKVLLIESDPKDARLVRRLLEESCPRFETVSAGSLFEGLDALAAGTFAVVLLDPGSAGSRAPEMLARIRRQAPGIPVIALGDEIASLQGADDYLPGEQLGPDRIRQAVCCAKERRDLHKRERELACLYSIARLTERPGLQREELFSEVLAVIPSALQYPEDAGARIVIDGASFCTGPVTATPRVLASGIWVHGRPVGALEVFYRSDHPEEEEGPFLKEERLFVDTVAGQLGRFVERIRTEKMLRESEERYRSIFTESLAVMLLIDPATGEIVDANPAASHFYGYPHDVLTRMTIADISTPNKEAILTEMADAAAERRNYFEFCHVLASGEVRDVEVYSGAITVKNRPLLHSIVHDITARKLAERALLESKIRVQAILESISDAFIAMDDERRITYTNEAAGRLLGMQRSEIVGKQYSEVFPGPESPAFEESLRRVLTGRHPATFEIFSPRHNRYFEVRVFPQERGLSLYISDISERKTAEERITRRNRQLYAINQVIGATSTSADPEDLVRKTLHRTLDLVGIEGGGVFLFNLSGRTARLIVGRGLPADLLPGTGEVGLDAPPFDRILAGEGACFADDHPGNAAIRAFARIPLTSDGGRLGAMILTGRRPHRFTDEEKSILVSIGREVGRALDRLMLQRRLEEANEQANFYLDVMAHDISNANTSSLMYATLLEEILTGDEKVYAQKLLTGIRQSIEIIGNVSTIRRLQEETAALAPTVLDTAIREVIRLFPEADVRYPGTDAVVLADDLLPEVFINLIGNAAKFGGPGVAIMIGVRERDGSVEVSVEDTGPGIPDPLKPEIFHRFRRSGGKKSGKGLGLYISRVLVERYGGEIRADDRVAGSPGEGAAIRFTLPKAAE